MIKMWFVCLKNHKNTQGGINERITKSIVGEGCWSGKASGKDDTWAGFGSMNENLKRNSKG